MILAMNPNTKHSQTFRARQKQAGLSEVRGIYAPKDQHAKIKQAAKIVAKLRIVRFAVRDGVIENV